MTRISSLILATGLAILPLSAFAQPTTAPSATPTAQPAATPTAQPATKAMAQPAVQTSKTDVKVPATTAKTEIAPKVTKSTHAKLNTKAPAVPAKTAEPSKS
jgi:hypothetical protein